MTKPISRPKQSGGARPKAGRPYTTGIGKQINFRYNGERWHLLTEKHGKSVLLAKIKELLDGLSPKK